MEKQIVSYIRHHTFSLTLLIFFAFVLLFLGEFFLYRKTQELNKMISESVMQIKESIKNVDED